MAGHYQAIQVEAMANMRISPPRNRILQGDVLAKLAELPDESVHMVVISPPYWGLRDYGCEGQYGLEPTLDEFLARMVAVFGQVRRVLRKDGTCWINMGDTYAGARRGPEGDKCGLEGSRCNQEASRRAQVDKVAGGRKPKDLCGVPWMLALALREDGWWLRSDIIWHKPSAMPSSVTDRPTVDHEYLFLLSKGRRYFYDADAVREKAVCGDHPRNVLAPPKAPGQPEHRGLRKQIMKATPLSGSHGSMGKDGLGHRYSSVYSNPTGRNLRTVWTIPTEPFPDAHFATFPSRLVERCIKAGTSHAGVCPACGAPWSRQTESERVGDRPKRKQGRKGDTLSDAHGQDGRSGNRCATVSTTTGWDPTCTCGREDRDPAIVLDPFMGSGTTALTALAMGRDYLGIELNPEYVAMAERRIEQRMQGLSLVRPPVAERRAG